MLQHSQAESKQASQEFVWPQTLRPALVSSKRLAELRAMSCKGNIVCAVHIPEIDFINCAGEIFLISQIARAASKLTISLLCRSQPSKRSKNCRWTLLQRGHPENLFEFPFNVLWIFFHDFCRIPDEHTKCHRVPQSGSSTRFASTKLLDHFNDRHSILLANEV